MLALCSSTLVKTSDVFQVLHFGNEVSKLGSFIPRSHTKLVVGVRNQGFYFQFSPLYNPEQPSE